MPQNTVLPDWRVTYPNDAPAMKPGGVTVLTTATAPRVPNKPTYTAGTIQIAGMEAEQPVTEEESQVEENEVEENEVEENEVDTEGVEEEDEEEIGEEEAEPEEEETPRRGRARPKHK